MNKKEIEELVDLYLPSLLNPDGKLNLIMLRKMVYDAVHECTMKHHRIAMKAAVEIGEN